MSLVVKGRKIEWKNDQHRIVETDVCVAASRAAGVWLVDGDDLRKNYFRMIVGATTEEEAARAYVMCCKANGRVPSNVFRVFPLASLEPIAMTGVVDHDGDETWSAFWDAWLEIRL